MKHARRWLMLLLALTMILGLSVGAFAEENQEEMDTTPYLSFRWLECDESGWWESENEDRGFSMTVFDCYWLTFYVNEWSGSEWVQTRVNPRELNTEWVVLTPFSELEESVHGGQKDYYFCQMRAVENGWDEAVSITYTMADGTEASMGGMIQRNEDGFYNSQKLSNDTYIQDYMVDPFAEENVFYFGFQSNGWNLNSLEIIEHGDKVNMEQINNNIYKFTIHDWAAQNIWWEEFFVRVRIEVSSKDDPDWVEYWEPGLRCYGIEQPAVDATIWINGQNYDFMGGKAWAPYIDGQWYDEETGESGDIWRYGIVELPEGVSYDLAANTLTLNNAHLERLELGYRWYDEWSGEEGFHLPNGDLTINLIGENTIICDYDMAVCLREEVNVTVAGEGSLYVKSVNSVDNTYIETYGDEDESNDTLCHHFYNAMNMEGGASLTVAGNADVTVELAGSALENMWRWNEETQRDEVMGFQNAFLCAVQGMGQGRLTLKDNAVLTTVLPEGARDNGPWVSEEEAWDGNTTPGGYRGLEGIRELNVHDNATLNTTTLHLADHTEWNEETQQEILVEAGTYNQTGGSVNITALGSANKQENWQWNEETQQNEYLGIVDHYHYEGLAARYGTIKVSGGVLNVTANATAEELASSAWAHAVVAEAGQIRVSGGTVNVYTNAGNAFWIGGWCNEWYDEEAGVTRVDGTWGGNLHITGGTVNAVGKENPGTTILNVSPYGKIRLDGGALNCVCSNNDNIYIEGEIEICGGVMDIQGVNDSMDTSYQVVDMARGSKLTVSGGTFNLFTQNRITGLYSEGKIFQSGGSINLEAAVTEEWEQLHGTGEDGIFYGVNYRPLVTIGRVELTGGSFSTKGYFGAMIHYDNGDIYNPEEWPAQEDGGLFISGDANVSIIGEQRGIQLAAPCEIKGGTVYVEGGDYGCFGVFNNGWVEGDIVVPSTTYLTITDGAVYLKSNKMDADLSEVTGYFGIVSNEAPVNIEGGIIEIEAPMVFYGLETVLNEDCYVVSMNSGEKLEMLQLTVSETYEGETYSYNTYFMEEDNLLGNEEDGYDYANHVLIYGDNKCGEDAYWNIEDGVLTISGTGPIYDTYFMRPDKPDEWILPPWYAFKEHITEAVVGEGITSVPNWTFALLENLTKVSFPSTVTDIATYSMNRSMQIKEYALAEGNETYDLYYGNTLVKGDTLALVAPQTAGAYVVPACVRVVGDDALILSQIESVTFEGDTAVIGNGAFSGCIALKSIELPDSLTTLGNGAFSGCTALEKIALNRNITSIGQMAFFNTPNLQISAQHESVAETYLKENDIAFTYIHEYADATCTEPEICKYCDATQGEALDHSFTNYVSDGNATCTADGTKTAKCDRCDVTDTVADEGSKLDHTYAEAWSVGADGHWHVCVCGDKKDFAAHDYGTDGDKCVICAYERDHVHNLTKVDAVAATCTTEGTKAYYTCSGCEDWFEDEAGTKVITDKNAIVVAKLDHTYGDWIVEGDKQTRTCSVCGATEEREIEKPAVEFKDVPADEYYAEPVQWAVAKEITNGYGSADTFAPDLACTRGQIVTFLWRANGSPEPKSSVNPFTDVEEDDYFYKAVLWAVENEITAGYGSETIFNPDGECTRAQVATFLWRAEGEPAPASSENPFTDVAAGQYYYDAVLWAVEQGITNGYGSDDVYAPDITCTRGQIVTFLYRAIAE